MSLMHVDAFSHQPLTGNPAAVLWIDAETHDRWPSDEWLQRFAAEMNQAETAFVGVDENHRDQFRLRWFSPVTEVDLCGHATLAAAHALQAWQKPRSNEIRFQTRSGLLIATAVEGNRIELNFPLEAAVATTPPPGLLEALGSCVGVGFVGKNRFDWIVELADEHAVRTLRPNMNALAEVECRGVIVTAAGSGKYDFVSRFFAPRYGIPEDPVTGSAHCCLAPFWHSRFRRQKMLGFQASPRGGEVQVQLQGDRVLLTGSVHTIFTAQLAIATR